MKQALESESAWLINFVDEIRPWNTVDYAIDRLAWISIVGWKMECFGKMCWSYALSCCLCFILVLFVFVILILLK